MSDRPNFLILFSDQQRYDTIGAAGYPHMKTPNLDRLVHEGCLFPNAYSPNPVCMPARHYLITGRAGRHHGYFGNTCRPIRDEGIPTIPQVLADSGYFTCAVGKMHFHPPTRHHGFDQMHLMEEIPTHRDDDAYLKYLAAKGCKRLRNIHGVRPYVYHDPQVAVMPAEDHGSSWVATQAIDVLERNPDRPFFMMCGWIKPHPPWNVPTEWQGLYDDVELPEAIPISRDFPYYEGESAWFGDGDSDEKRRAIRAAYFTTVSMVDSAVGRVLEYLEKSGRLDNTFIIYTSDHGEMLQDKGLYQKAVPYDSAARIPFIVRYPELFEAGSTDRKFVDLLDIFPTILDAAGIDYYYKEAHRRYALDGGSFLPGTDKERDRNYQWADNSSGRGRWVLLRDERYKYVYFYNDGTEQFYDLQEDPQETQNLVRLGRVPEEPYNRLKRKCIELEAERGPEGSVKDGNFVAFERHEGNPSRPGDSGSRFPHWANKQFQTFGEESPAEEGQLYVDEIKRAMTHYPPEFLSNLAPGPEWTEGWKENFRDLGGTDAGINEVIGE